MSDFKTLELEDYEIFSKYLKGYRFNTYEYSFLTLYLWKDYCKVKYKVMYDSLIVMKEEEKKGAYFMQPIGGSMDTLSETISELIRIKENDTRFKCLFGDVEESFLLHLKQIYGARVKYVEDVKNFDYIYETERLITLSGEKLHKKKNHYNQFTKGYNYEVKDIQENKVVQDCLAFAEVWFESLKVKYKELIYELEGIRNILTHMEELNALGMAVYVEDKVVGFTVGEKVNDQMAVIHVEKGDIDYKGVYAFINKTFAERYLKEVPYINREEDLGMVKLRKAKQAYDPLRLEKKYMVNIQ